MYAVLICIAAVAAGSPIAAAFIVALASRREDRDWSLGGPPHSHLEAIARRIVAFDADSVEWPRSKAQVQAEMTRRGPFPKAPDAESDGKTRDAA
jgi:hypothetical protein